MLIAELKDNQLALFAAGSKLATAYYEDEEIKGLFHTNEDIINLDDLKYSVKIFKTGETGKYTIEGNRIKKNAPKE